MPNNMTKTLYGEVELASLEVGKPAYIQTSMGLVQTSPVVHFVVNPDNTCFIGTQNSCYLVKKS